MGGLWVTKQDSVKKLQKWRESRKFDAIKTQFSKLLNSKPGDKILLQFSVNGIHYTLEELI